MLFSLTYPNVIFMQDNVLDFLDMLCKHLSSFNKKLCNQTNPFHQTWLV